MSDQSSWGVVLAKAPSTKLRRAGGGGTVSNLGFRIAPGADNHEVRATTTFEKGTYLSSMMPHMHVRGKSARYTIVYPDGRREVALWVPSYDFNWQLSYELEEPIFMPEGSQLEVVFHYDNSTANRYNPDPTAEVGWGDQTWEEMMLGFYGTVEAPGPEPSTQGQQ